MLARRLANRLIRLTGYPQEYVCLDAAALDGTFRWALDGRIIDPRRLLFFGYRPLVIGLSVEVTSDRPVLELSMTGEVVAGLCLERIAARVHDIALFTGRDPWQRFLPWMSDRLDRVRQRLNMRGEGNVTKAMDEYDMLRISYAQPREIHLAVVGPRERSNIFPTDLHGPVGNDRYVISLRHTGKACQQVQEHGRLLLCRMALDRHREVYRLGSRHMAGAQHAPEIIEVNDAAHGHAVPAGAHSAQLLGLLDHVDVGIHRLLRFTVKDRVQFSDGPVLAHMHAGPLGWLKRNASAPRVLLR